MWRPESQICSVKLTLTVMSALNEWRKKYYPSTNKP